MSTVQGLLSSLEPFLVSLLSGGERAGAQPQPTTFFGAATNLALTLAGFDVEGTPWGVEVAAGIIVAEFSFFAGVLEGALTDPSGALDAIAAFFLGTFATLIEIVLKAALNIQPRDCNTLNGLLIFGSFGTAAAIVGLALAILGALKALNALPLFFIQSVLGVALAIIVWLGSQTLSAVRDRMILLHCSGT